MADIELKVNQLSDIGRDEIYKELTHRINNHNYNHFPIGLKLNVDFVDNVAMTNREKPIVEPQRSAQLPNVRLNRSHVSYMFDDTGQKRRSIFMHTFR